MRRMITAVAAAVLAFSVPAVVPAVADTQAGTSGTNATYYNDAAFTAADPYVLYDKASGYYYAYSTDGADRGWDFAIYRSADLSTWQKLPGGALPANDPNQWANTWFWAPEVYYNSKTGLYFMFYAGRSDKNKLAWFGYSNFEEPSKVGVAVSRSPAGPFHNISNQPIDYWPYDPNYHDVNLIMGPDQKKPPATQQEGETAPLGTYIPFIDPDVFFDSSGKMYFYYSRNAYRNWVWDDDLNKYIEESNIYAVPITTAWWNDPTGQTMPSIDPNYVDANKTAGDTSGKRKDGFVRILDYDHDKQPWENADVNDYANTNGQNKDRRWEEGSTTWERTVNGKTVYYLTYSANNFATANYGVGYATASSPLGPWKKYAGNPILTQNTAMNMYSTGHGSIVASPDGSQLYYVHHARPTPTAPNRRLYTERLLFDNQHPDVNGDPSMRIVQSVTDQPMPSGVAPYSITAGAADVTLTAGGSQQVIADVRNADGGSLALGNPRNRVTATVGDPTIASLTNATGSGVTIAAGRPGRTWLRLTYQRQLSDGSYRDVVNTGPVAQHGPVSVVVPVSVTG